MIHIGAILYARQKQMCLLAVLLYKVVLSGDVSGGPPVFFIIVIIYL